MASTKKAFAISRDMFDRMKVRLPALTAVETIGSAGDPLLKFGTFTTNVAHFMIRVVPSENALAKDVLGNTAIKFGPHTVEIGTETNFAATTDNIADNLTPAMIMALIGDVVHSGCEVKWYQSTYGTAVTEAVLGDAAKLVATWPADLYYPKAGQ